MTVTDSDSDSDSDSDAIGHCCWWVGIGYTGAFSAAKQAREQEQEQKQKQKQRFCYTPNNKIAATTTPQAVPRCCTGVGERLWRSIDSRLSFILSFVPSFISFHFISPMPMHSTTNVSKEKNTKPKQTQYQPLCNINNIPSVNANLRDYGHTGCEYTCTGIARPRVQYTCTHTRVFQTFSIVPGQQYTCTTRADAHTGMR